MQLYCFQDVPTLKGTQIIKFDQLLPLFISTLLPLLNLTTAVTKIWFAAFGTSADKFVYIMQPFIANKDVKSCKKMAAELAGPCIGISASAERKTEEPYLGISIYA